MDSPNLKINLGNDQHHKISTLQLAWADGILPHVRLTPAELGLRSNMPRGFPIMDK
jgi:hypothetical protein